MEKYTGIQKATKKDGTIYYRAGITYKKKHISLGSFPSKKEAHSAYLEAQDFLIQSEITPDNCKPLFLSYEKAIILLNYRDNGFYFKTPVYMHTSYISYHYNKEITYTFDVDDLFFYGNHKIMKRGNHLFVSDYGMQTNILNRYGIKNFGVANRDYVFANGNPFDFRYSNIILINHYHGVRMQIRKNQTLYAAYLHINGDYLIGRYDNETTAAIAYNKAVDFIHRIGCKKAYPVNYIEGLSPSKYADIYNSCKISERLLHLEINET